jgi:hypothetical protein
MKIPRLSVMGIMRINVLKSVSKSANKTVSEVSKFDWGDALADALIVSGIGFLAAFGGTGAAGVPTKEALWAAFVTAGVQFLTIMGLKRGLITKKAGA